jgi:hypothetical protein
VKKLFADIFFDYFLFSKVAFAFCKEMSIFSRFANQPIRLFISICSVEILKTFGFSTSNQERPLLSALHLFWHKSCQFQNRDESDRPNHRLFGLRRTVCRLFLFAKSGKSASRPTLAQNNFSQPFLVSIWICIFAPFCDKKVT